MMKRTARKKLQGAKRRMKEWIKANRHLPGHTFVSAGRCNCREQREAPIRAVRVAAARRLQAHCSGHCRPANAGRSWPSL